jgi:16S rRNA processing protein RimM
MKKAFDEEQVLIGLIKRAHGIKGEVLIDPQTFNVKRFGKGIKVAIRFSSGEMKSYTIASSRNAAQGILIKFAEIPDRNEAELLRGAEICIPISERLPLPDNRAYYDELIGMKVVDNVTSEELGVVRDVKEMPQGDLYIIKLNDGSEKLITSAGTEIIKLDKKKKEIRVKLLEDY